YFNELLTFGFNSIGHLLKFNRALTYFKKLLFSYKNIDNDDWVFLTAFAMYGDEQTLSKAGIKELVDPLLNIRKNDFEKEIDLLMFNLSNEFTSSFNSFFSYDILKDEIIELETLIEEKKKEAIVLIKNYGLEYINRWINNNEEVLEKLQMFASQI
ncbi:MAG: hypothetical protein SOV26_04795, partial [Candidatus Onthovivens sp.]|nr:hypothetical protein [Candidatus Onthovivens sp.]